MWISRVELGGLLYKISGSKMIESALTGKTIIHDEDEPDQATHHHKRESLRFMLCIFATFFM